MTHFAILDIEATGGSPAKDRIIELAIYRHDGQKVVDSFETLIKPEIVIPPFIAQLTGISNKMVEDSPRFFEIAKRVVEITDDAVLVAHNARFDFTYLQNEYKRLGYEYRRKRLCTLRLSRYLFPGLSSYSLPSICQHFGIRVQNRHRAFGDAQATVLLFEQLREQDQDGMADFFIHQRLKEEDLPPNLKKEQVDELPEEPGVYFMKDEVGQIMYVGKSVDIKRRIFQHITGKFRSDKQSKMVKNIHHIDYELTGSDLLACIREDYLIKQLRPRYNKAQKSKGFDYGIFSFEDEHGYTRLKIGKLAKKREQPIARFDRQSAAETAIRRMIKRQELCTKMCGLERTSGACFSYRLKACHGACIQQESASIYNNRLQEAISVYEYPHKDFVIIERGRTEDESALIYIQDSRFLGYCYFERNLANPESLLQQIEIYPENPALDRFIRQYIRKNDLDLRPVSPGSI